MTWTTVKPTVTGFWWYRKRPLISQDVAHVQEHKGILYVDWGSYYEELVEEMTGEWSSHPLTPPSEGEAR